MLVLSQNANRLERLLHLVGGRIRPSKVSALGGLGASIVHAHFGPDAVQAMPLANRLRLPLVVTFHGYDATWSARKLWHSGWRNRVYVLRRGELASRGALFLAVSNFLREKLTAQGFPGSKVVRHYMGVDTSWFTPTGNCRDTAAERRVLFVGRLVRSKGVHLLLKAMVRVQAMVAEAELVVIGDGPERATLESTARSLRVRAKFVGARKADEVRGWMDNAAVFSLPSVRTAWGAEEAFGLAAVEAQSMGLPAIGFSTGGVPEAIAHGYSGYLAAPGDWTHLGDRIAQVLLDHDHRRQLGAHARERARREFDLRTQCRSLEGIYDQVTNSHRTWAGSSPAVASLWALEPNPDLR